MPARARPSLIPLALITMASLAQAADARRTRPPNSIRPMAEKRPVRVLHTHHRVQKCKRALVDGKPRCLTELAQAEGSATVRFERLGAPSTVRREAERAIVVKLPARIGRQEATVELGRGQWSVDWRGYASRANLALHATAAPLIELVTTTGRCELEGAECRHDRETVVRNMTITDRGR